MMTMERFAGEMLISTVKDAVASLENVVTDVEVDIEMMVVHAEEM